MNNVPVGLIVYLSLGLLVAGLFHAWASRVYLRDEGSMFAERLYGEQPGPDRFNVNIVALFVFACWPVVLVIFLVIAGVTSVSRWILARWDRTATRPRIQR